VWGGIPLKKEKNLTGGTSKSRGVQRKTNRLNAREPTEKLYGPGQDKGVRKINLI